MNCRRCNTPIPSRSTSCPNCGQHVSGGESFIDDPGEGGVDDVAGESSPLSPSMLADPNVEPAEVDVELDLEDEAELSLDEAVTPAARAGRSQTNASSKSATSRPAPAVTPKAKPVAAVRKAPVEPPPRRAVAPKLPDPAPARTSSRSPSRSPSRRPSRESGAAPERALLPDAETVRVILAQHPELIEPGLEVLVDDGGEEIGVQHATDVGVIDVLARDAKGALVAVMVVGADHGGDVVAEALHRLGWVRKHLAKSGEDVRGVVLTDHLDEQVAYAAAAVAGTLCFKSYALSLSLVDLDV